jgi:diaminopimelate decarboxylase
MPLQLKLSDNEIKDLVNTYNTPLQVYDGDLIVKNLINFLNLMKTYFPKFKQYFAVKALPNPHILKLLVDNNSYLDCSSLSELKLAEKIGLSGDSIMFTSNYTSKEDLSYARKLNAIINLDDITLLDDLKSIGPLPDIISFRLNPKIGKTDSETKSNILGGEEVKFGIPEFQIVESYLKAKEFGIKRFGLHIMTGSNVTTLSYWDDLIEELFINVNKLYQNGITLEFINLGGGIGIPYKPESKEINIIEFANKQNLI